MSAASERIAVLEAALKRIESYRIGDNAGKGYGLATDLKRLQSLARAALAGVGEGPSHRCTECGVEWPTGKTIVACTATEDKLHRFVRSADVGEGTPETCPNVGCVPFNDGKFIFPNAKTNRTEVCQWPGHTDPTPPNDPDMNNMHDRTGPHENNVHNQSDPTPPTCPSCGSLNRWNHVGPCREEADADPWHTDPTGTTE